MHTFVPYRTCWLLLLTALAIRLRYKPTYDKLRVLIINKDVRKLLARKNGNKSPIWSWNDSTQSEAEKETKGWDRLPPTSQRVILVASSTNITSIPTSPPPTIHRFPNARNTTALQDLFFSNLSREQYLLTHLILSVPPTREHPGHPRPGRADRTFASPNPSIFRRTRELPVVGNENQSPTVHGTGLLIKRRSGRATGPEGPHPRVNKIAASFDAKLCEDSGVLPGKGDTNLFSMGMWPQHIDRLRE